MTGWGLVFLGVIALASLVQTAFLIGLAIGGRRLARRIDELQGRLDRELRPALEDLSRVTRNLREFSELATLQAHRVDGLLADTFDKIEGATSTLQRLIVRPLGPLLDVAAFFKGVRRAVDVYQQLSSFARRDRTRSRRGADDDEHMFI